MAVKAPDWLLERGGDLRLASDGVTWYVYVDSAPQFALSAVPVSGKFGCSIRQTVNGRRVEHSTTYPTAEAAISGGVEFLRKELGWG